MEANKDLEKKEFEVLIPKTKINPGSHRALIVSVTVEGVKNKAGLIIPSAVIKKDQNKNNMEIIYKRYFVVKASKDFVVDLKEPDIQLQPGDELFPLVYDGVTNINLPKVKDWEMDGIEIEVIHDSEIMGWRQHDPKRFSEVSFCSCTIPNFVKRTKVYEEGKEEEIFFCTKCEKERIPK